MLLEAQRAVPDVREAPQLALQKKVEELEKKQEFLMEEIRLLGETRQKTTQQKRMRRGASPGQGDMAPLPTEDCIPGTYGCPLYVTPYNIGGSSSSCILCPAGPRGNPGPVGPPGRDGRDAISVFTNPGCPSTAGADETNQPTETPPISGHTGFTPPSNTSGAVYIRWGHHSCPLTSMLIYSGSAAAPHYASTGNGANQLCLPEDPIYDQPVAGVGGSRAFLYGLEYQVDSFPTHNNRLWHDVPCAVCKAPSRFAKLMIPGKNICPDEDWTLEYGGYLMAERAHSAHRRSLHICVDREMETLRRTSGAAGVNCVSVDTSVGSSMLQPQDEVPISSQDVQLIKLQEKIEELEKKQESLTKEISLLRETRQEIGSVEVKQTRMRRNAPFRGATTPLPTEDCIPGTNGCPRDVTQVNVGSTACILCPAGPRGYPGPVGPPGRDGRDAMAAFTYPGSPDTAENDETNQQPTETPPISRQPGFTPPRNTSGAVYIRWGHRSCPSTSTLIYSGIAAAPHYHSRGNGANQLCLPEEPEYDEPVGGVGGSRAFLYGLEYQIDSFPTRNNRLWHDVPCAVCKAPSRFAKLMIPGRNICPDEEWTLEYGGYLMAERSHNDHRRSLHICVDREMETIPRTAGAAAGSVRGLLDLVEGRCSASGGGIPCGPYVDGYEITCAVCTQ
ncbi:Short-chain collagen C4 [Holothuria leucospilota]|uniref:Short-chain collagen C4 n=1 Tax=Holothuria leucospilota TaxID=206669 RepID=A0A9Q1CAG1_HOLLE|nr:Short-chain collagen C4 [Holothuria leucospilota]